MSKYNLTDLYEGMSDKEFADAKEADRLEAHPERDKIKAIQALLAKEKDAVKEDKYDDMVAKDDDIPADKKKAAALAYRKVDKGDSYEKATSHVKEIFTKDGGSEDSVDNIDKVASPSAKGVGYSSSVDSSRSEDSAEQAGTTKTTKPMYTENKMSLVDLAKKLGIDVDELEAKVRSFKGKEDDAIEASAKKSMAEENDEEKMPMDEVRVDNEVSERIEGMLSIPLKKKFLDSFMDLWQDLIEEDPFYAEDVINHLNNEMHKEIDGYQAAGDKLAGLEENGEVKDYSEELSEGAYKDFIMQAREAYSQSEVEAYIESLNNDMRLNGSDQYNDFDVEDYLEDFRNYVDDKMGDVREHFSRFK
jgi:hypothetical protein|tara:strand:- start:1717 stop:2799 length:1083 start_codon:yes stop_codon:yes gene_type:complete